MSTRPDNSEAAYIWDALNSARNARVILAEVSLDGPGLCDCRRSPASYPADTRPPTVVYRCISRRTTMNSRTTSAADSTV